MASSVPTMVTADDVSRLRAGGGLKWSYFDEDVLAAWVAEMDFGLAPSVSEALHDAVERGDTGYPYPLIERRAAAAATSFWDDRLGWSVPPERVFPAPDVVEGTRRAISLLTPPGTPVILHSPVYFPFFSMVERAGRDVVEVPCSPGDDGRYSLDLDRIEQAFAGGAGSLVLCNPWNPTGRSLSRAEIEQVVGLAETHDARILSDEIHAPLTYQDTRHVPAASLSPETVVTVTSASKAWDLPGLKCAQVVLTCDADVEKWSSYYTPEKVGAGTFGLIANAAAYGGGRMWLVEVMRRLEANRSLLDRLVETLLPAVRYSRPEAGYLAWLDFRAYGLDNPAEHLLEKARVALTDGNPFGSGGLGHARLNFATHEPVVIEIVERMAKELEK